MIAVMVLAQLGGGPILTTRPKPKPKPPAPAAAPFAGLAVAPSLTASQAPPEPKPQPDPLANDVHGQIARDSGLDESPGPNPAPSPDRQPQAQAIVSPAQPPRAGTRPPVAGLRHLPDFDSQRQQYRCEDDDGKAWYSPYYDWLEEWVRQRNAEIARRKAQAQTQAPAAPAVYRLADSSGQVWMHADPQILRAFIAQRNAGLVYYGVDFPPNCPPGQQ